MTSTALSTASTLDPMLLTMDVVDTLRREAAHRDEALGQDAQEAALVQRVRQSYTDQGIAVSESIIAEAVQALRERRYAYTPAAPSLSVKLARAYINRGVWGKPVLASLAGLIVLVSAGWTVHTAIESSHRSALTQSLNAAQVEVARLGEQADAVDRLVAQQATPALAAAADKLREAKAGVQLARSELAGVSTTLPTLLQIEQPQETPGREDLAQAVERARTDLKVVAATVAAAQTATTQASALETLHQQLDELARTPVRSDLTSGLASRVGQVRDALDMGQDAKAQTLATQVRAFGRTSASIDRVAGETAALSGVAAQAARTLIEQAVVAANGGNEALTQTSLEQAQAIAQMGPAVARVQNEVATWSATGQAAAREPLAQALAAVAAGRPQDAAPALERLAALQTRLNQAYTLQIVSRPGVKSGVTRIPNDSPNKTNYYVVVEALGPNGQAMNLDITSEEDQRTRNVNLFAVHVSHEFFEKMKADKLDNGIIDERQLGVKQLGELEPDYQVPVTGGFITSW